MTQDKPRKHPDEIQRTNPLGGCEICGEPFMPRPNGSRRKYCGQKCKRKANNARYYKRNQAKLTKKARKRKRRLAYLKRKANAVPIEPSPRRDFARQRPTYDKRTNFEGAKKVCRGCGIEFEPASHEALYHSEACKRRAQNRKNYERRKAKQAAKQAAKR